MAEQSLTHAERFKWMQAVLADATFTHAQKNVLIRLALHLNLKSGRLDPSIETLAAGTGVSERAVQTALAKAQDLTWILRHVGGGRGHTNSYSLLPKPSAGAETLHRGAAFYGQTVPGRAPFEETPNGESAFGEAQKGATVADKPCTGVHPNNKNNEKNNAGLQVEFEQWWELFPRRVGKGHARRAFEKIVQAGRVSIDELKEGAKRYAAECAAANREPRYIKHPATWLNGECWADEPLSMVTGDVRTSRTRGKVAGAGGWDPRL